MNKVAFESVAACREVRGDESQISNCCQRVSGNGSVFVKFCARTALRLLVPAAGYCIILSWLWPLYWMWWICSVVMGLLLGLVMFMKPAAGQVSCMPGSCASMMTDRSGRLQVEKGFPYGLPRLDEMFS